MSSVRETLFAPLPRGLSVALCALVVASIVVAARSVLFVAPSTAHPVWLTAGATIDLTLTASLVIWWMLRRDFGWSSRALVTLVIAAVTFAGLVLPADQQTPLPVLQLATAPLELLLIVYLVRRVSRARREARSRSGRDFDLRTSIRSGVVAIVGEGRFAEIVADEISALYFALSPKSLSRDGSSGNSEAASSTAAHTDTLGYHRKAVYGQVVAVFILISLGEIPALHLLAGLWSERFAWILTALGIYGILWLVGDWRATRALPLRVDDKTLRIRFGLRWRLDIPLEDIVEMREPTLAEQARRGAVDLKLALPLARWKVLVLRRPVIATAMYGFRRRVQTLGLGLDEPERLAALLVDPTLEAEPDSDDG